MAPGEGYLYELTVELVDEATALVDSLPAAGRHPHRRRSTGTRFLINGEPFYFTGFGKHEDAPVRGKGHDDAFMVHDFELMEWIGANSFRTSHYPYAEEVLDYADRHGIVVIDETAAVGLNMRRRPAASSAREPLHDLLRGHDQRATQEVHAQAIRELIARDKNHPCVVMWSIANEPESDTPEARDYFEPLVDETRGARPDPAGRLRQRDARDARQCDVITDLFDVADAQPLLRLVHRHRRPRGGRARARGRAARWAEKHGKPIIMTEYGADTCRVCTASSPTPWTEEYQVELPRDVPPRLRPRSRRSSASRSGTSPTSPPRPGIIRVDGNKKGVFTRDRRPKAGAHAAPALATTVVSDGAAEGEGEVRKRFDRERGDARRQLTDRSPTTARAPSGRSVGRGLRWVDMLAGDVLSLGTDGAVGRRHVGRHRGGTAAAAGGRCGDRRRTGLRPRGRRTAPSSASRTVGRHEIRMNEGGCDPDGRFYCGTMAYDQQTGRRSMYRLDPDGSVEVVLGGSRSRTGLDWSPDGSLPTTTTPTRSGSACSTTTVSEGLTGRRGSRRSGRTARRADRRRRWQRLGRALNGGAGPAFGPGRRARGRRRGRTKKVTACTFGGPDLDQLFITTSREGLQSGVQPLAGALFRADGGHGSPDTRVRRVGGVRGRAARQLTEEVRLAPRAGARSAQRMGTTVERDDRVESAPLPHWCLRCLR